MRSPAQRYTLDADFSPLKPLILEALMPWSPGDGPKRHTKAADTPAKKKQWSSTANSVLKESGDEGKAVRIANSAVKKHPSRKK